MANFFIIKAKALLFFQFLINSRNKKNCNKAIFYLSISRLKVKASGNKQK